MSEFEDRSGLRARGEEAIGELAQALLDNPIFNQAVGKALGAGERAVAAQRGAINALSLATSSDLERVEQRLRSLSHRLEAMEDNLDQMAADVAGLRKRLREERPVSTDQGSLAVADGED